MSRDAARTRLLVFLDTIRHPDVRLEAIDENTSLVAAGLIDSLALLEIVTLLESEFGVDLAGSGVDPTRLSTMAGYPRPDRARTPDDRPALGQRSVELARAAAPDHAGWNADGSGSDPHPGRHTGAAAYRAPSSCRRSALFALAPARRIEILAAAAVLVLAMKVPPAVRDAGALPMLLTMLALVALLVPLLPGGLQLQGAVPLGSGAHRSIGVHLRCSGWRARWP